MNPIYKTKNFKAVLLITGVSLVFTLILSHAFLHIHTMADGKIVVHSHPSSQPTSNSDSNKTPAKHNHSNIEYYYYQALSQHDKFILIAVTQKLHILEERIFRYTINDIIPSFTFSYNYSLRAPPTC